MSMNLCGCICHRYLVRHLCTCGCIPSASVEPVIKPEWEKLIEENERLKAENKTYKKQRDWYQVGYNIYHKTCVALTAENEQLKTQLQSKFDVGMDLGKCEKAHTSENVINCFACLPRWYLSSERRNENLCEKIEQLKEQLQQAKCLHCNGEGKITVGGKSDKNGYVYPVDIPCPECKPQPQHYEVSSAKLNSKPACKPIGITDDGHYVYALEPTQYNQ